MIFPLSFISIESQKSKQSQRDGEQFPEADGMAFEKEIDLIDRGALRLGSSGLRLGCGCRRFQNPGSTPDDRKQVGDGSIRGLKSSSNLKDTT